MRVTSRPGGRLAAPETPMSDQYPIADGIQCAAGSRRRWLSASGMLDGGVDGLGLGLGAGEQLGRWWLHHPTVPRRRVVAHFVTFTSGALATLSAPERGSVR